MDFKAILSLICTETGFFNFSFGKNLFRSRLYNVWMFPAMHNVHFQINNRANNKVNSEYVLRSHVHVIRTYVTSGQPHLLAHLFINLIAFKCYEIFFFEYLIFS